jgi:ATP-binding protein involved in chromosome partitioning
VQNIPLTGVIIVTTPQNVALHDVRKTAAMFQNDNINIPILGVVENMSWFTPQELPENKYYIFGKEEGKNLATELGVSLLAQIPLIQSVAESGDKGTPAATYGEQLVEKVIKEIKRIKNSI